MSVVLTRVPRRNQKAVYWPPLVLNPVTGDRGVGVPVLIACRWEDTKTEFVAEDGTDQHSRSVVYPDLLLTIGGWLFHDADDAEDTDNAPADPKASKLCFQIRGFSDIPNPRARKHLLIAYV